MNQTIKTLIAYWRIVKTFRIIDEFTGEVIYDSRNDYFSRGYDLTDLVNRVKVDDSEDGLVDVSVRLR